MDEDLNLTERYNLAPPPATTEDDGRRMADGFGGLSFWGGLALGAITLFGGYVLGLSLGPLALGVGQQLLPLNFMDSLKTA